MFEEQVQAPFAALVEAAAAGCAAPSRPRPAQGVPDLPGLRFSRDKTPYKTSLSASIPRPPEEGDGPGVGTGFYVNVGPAGLYTASGLYHPVAPSWSGSGPPWPTRPPAPSWRPRRAKPPARPGAVPRPLQRMTRPGPATTQRPTARRPPPWPQPPARPRPLVQSAELLDHLLADCKAMVLFHCRPGRFP